MYVRKHTHLSFSNNASHLGFNIVINLFTLMCLNALNIFISWLEFTVKHDYALNHFSFVRICFLWNASGFYDINDSRCINQSWAYWSSPFPRPTTEWLSLIQPYLKQKMLRLLTVIKKQSMTLSTWYVCMVLISAKYKKSINYKANWWSI